MLLILQVDVLYKLRRRISSYLFPIQETPPDKAYNKWAENYDNQPGNLMMDLDEALFSGLIGRIVFKDKVVADVGCGTGRHWNKIYAANPSRLIGYDVSEGMLKVLKEKFPQAETYQLKDNRLRELENESCDTIISTLAIAHIGDIKDALTEWNHVLKTGGHIVITDYHPEMLAHGGNRTFVYNGKQVAVKNYVHPIEEIKAIADKLGLKMTEFIEKKVDASVEHYYRNQQAMHVYNRFKGTPVIYGAHFIKQDVVK